MIYTELARDLETKRKLVRALTDLVLERLTNRSNATRNYNHSY
jgi:phenylpyruvate tautomerase PptA (4-oxalocrotonate tautomerase family)